jgi:hypothetical protein
MMIDLLCTICFMLADDIFDCLCVKEQIPELPTNTMEIIPFEGRAD